MINSENNPFRKVVIKIENMTCPMCVKHVRESLSDKNGIIVKKVKIGKVVAVIHDSVSDGDIRSFIQDDSEYKVKSIKRK